MKRFARLLSLSLCALLLGVSPALAAEPEEAPEYLSPVPVWGRVTRLENGGILLENPNENDPYREVILHPGDAPCLDGVTGLPLDWELRDGETAYAWIGPAVTLSLPPQAAAELVVANLPADFSAPEYYQIARRVLTAEGSLTLTATGGETLTVTEEATLLPYLTRQMVTLDSLIPGSRILVWRDGGGAVTKVMLFADAYRGYACWNAAGEASVNGEALSVSGRTVNGQILLPIRATAEAAGYQVDWVAGKGAVVTDGGTPVFSVLPGQSLASTPDGEMYLSGACFFENGVTYLPAGDLLSLLNLFRTY